jgi:hypothetical protein
LEDTAVVATDEAVVDAVATVDDELDVVPEAAVVLVVPDPEPLEATVVEVEVVDVDVVDVVVVGVVRALNEATATGAFELEFVPFPSW